MELKISNMPGQRMMIRLSKILLIPVLIVFSISGYAKGLTVLFTNDIHGHLTAEKTGGFARLCTEVRKQRKLAEGRGDDSIFVVPGDIFQGTLISSFSRGAAEFAALQACGVDAIAMGNHDFDYGLDRILKLAKAAKFPVLCANCRYRHSKTLVFKPSAFIKKGKKTLFLLGLVTPDTPRITAGQKDMKRLKFFSAIGIVKHYKKQNNMIILSHLGFPADRHLAKSLSDTVIIGGHTHTVLKKCRIRNKIPICQAGAYARYLGVMHLRYAKKHLKYLDSKLIPITADIPADPKVMKVITPWIDKVKNRASNKTGRSAVSFKANGAAMHNRETVLGDLVCDAMLEKTGVDAGFVNAGGIRWGLDKGIVTFGDIYRVLPFDNRIFILKIRGKALKRVLRHIIKKRGRNGFMQICGMSVTISHGHIRKLLIHGKPLYRNMIYSIATIGFLVRGGDGYGFLRRYRHKDTGLLLRDSLVDFVRRHKVITWPSQGRWNFDTGL